VKVFLSNFSKVIRELRLEKGFSQEAMAHEIGMSPSGYGKIERGETDLTISKIESIAQVFGLTASSLISIVDRENKPESSSALENPCSGQFSKEQSVLNAAVLRLQDAVSILAERVSKLEKM
jgi:transcriptional regulator with XRE-family HTH domain